MGAHGRHKLEEIRLKQVVFEMVQNPFTFHEKKRTMSHINKYFSPSLVSRNVSRLQRGKYLKGGKGGSMQAWHTSSARLAVAGDITRVKTLNLCL